MPSPVTTSRAAGKVIAALAEPRLAVRPELARAMVGTIALAAAQLLLLRDQRKAWERRMGELLPGAPRTAGTRPPETLTRGRRSRPARST